MQIYSCRIRFRETIPKISFNMSTICISYRLKTLRECLTRVTNDFLGDFGPLLPQLTFRASKLWWWTVEILLLRYDQVSKSRGFSSGEDGAYFSLVTKCGTFSENHSWVFLAPCDGAECCWKDQGRFWMCSRDQGNYAPTKGYHLDSSVGSISPLVKKRRDFFRTLLRLVRLSLRSDIAS